ncbi:hypothetical protein VF21_10415 [Pseudogymnoascus sp. 05NY08]|nr:hypothetical protein VF21_10415 [Pseudogymnoascus sp. 05NY08]
MSDAGSYSSVSSVPASPSRDSSEPPPTLDRVCCLRCAKRLEVEADVPCVFSNPRSTKCERCTLLKSKCVPALLALQATYLSDPTPGRRLAVSIAARDLASEVEVLARREPKTPMEASLALLREQRETNRLLGLLLAQGARMLGEGV